MVAVVEANALAFAAMGLVGGLLYVLIWAKKASDIISFESLRHLAVAFVAGLIYFFLHSDFNFPNGVMAAVIGYFGPDLISAFFEQLRARILPKEEKREETKEEAK